jgi:hypothetical protein
MVIGTGLVLGWVVYLGTTAYIGWRILAGDPPPFLANYSLGMNAAWVMIGIMLWLATEWMRGFRT